MNRERQIQLSKRSGYFHPALVFAALTGLSLFLYVPHAALGIVIDCAIALILLVPFATAGLWLVPFQSSENWPLRRKVLIGAGLGIGAQSLLMLGLSLAGWLHRPVVIGATIAATLAGVIRARLLFLTESQSRKSLSKVSNLESVHTSKTARDSNSNLFCWLWLLAVPFAVLALAGSSNAPGFVWKEEGFGYDILEYHLQLPKEYRQLGRMTYLPHNVYASFPLNVEMLYLHAMIVLDDDLDMGTVANSIHLILGALTVAAIWAAARDVGRRAGVVAGVLTATCGWLVYLSALAYVEHGLLFFGALSAGCLLRAIRMEINESPANDPLHHAQLNRWFLLAGVFSGLSCGCKYTAVPLFAAPSLFALLFAKSDSIPSRLRYTALFTIGWLVTLAPWLARNYAFTGNPVFPLASEIFTASSDDWGPAENLRWTEGHKPKGDEATLTGRLTGGWHRVLTDDQSRLAPGLFLLALAGAWFGRRDNGARWLAFCLLFQVVVWLFATHVYARFAVTMLVPLVLLSCYVMAQSGKTLRLGFALFLLAANALIGLVPAIGLQQQESLNAPASLMYEGSMPGYEYYGVVNNELPANARVLLIGEARPFYFRRHVDYAVVFNRNRFLDLLESKASPNEIMLWLRECGYTNILINWSEVVRLRTYGFPDILTPNWLNTMQEAGLRITHRFHLPDNPNPYVDICAVP